MKSSRLIVGVHAIALVGIVLCRGSSGEQPKATTGAKRTSIEETITNSIGMKLRVIPIGEFVMGNSHALEEELAVFGKPYRIDPIPGRWLKDEYPRHRVRITKTLVLGTYEVTVGQFRQFIQDSHYITSAEKEPNKGAVGWDSEADRFSFKTTYSWRNTGFPQTDEHPVVNVSWNDAVAFCEWLSAKERTTNRLPTEAEWEYACRAGSHTRYCNGDDPEELPQVANVDDVAAKTKFPGFQHGIHASDGYVFTAPVGRFRPNTFGLFDMHGNVSEWCSDWYGKDYYTKSPESDPNGPDSGKYRVQRGGSWFDIALFATSASRVMCKPDYRSFEIGFRVVMIRGNKEVEDRPAATKPAKR